MTDETTGNPDSSEVLQEKLAKLHVLLNPPPITAEQLVRDMVREVRMRKYSEDFYTNPRYFGDEYDF